MPWDEEEEYIQPVQSKQERCYARTVSEARACCGCVRASNGGEDLCRRVERMGIAQLRLRAACC